MEVLKEILTSGWFWAGFFLGLYLIQNFKIWMRR